jgi:hypothetical protein
MREGNFLLQFKEKVQRAYTSYKVEENVTVTIQLPIWEPEANVLERVSK